MYLFETLTYSNPTYNHQGVLHSFDLTQDDRTVTFKPELGKESWKVYYQHLDEQELQNDMIDFVIIGAYDYIYLQEDLKRRKRILESNILKYSSDELDVIQDKINSCKPVYDNLAKLLGTTERLEKALDEEKAFNLALNNKVDFDMDDRTAYRNNDW